ncbi:LCP family protein [Staphylospora marina]|uniref:LCP family glycopolymer transferase n=1 Tax=Staphylospora marina TaxID=2490858 RepID=UPI000F5C20DD|nr:LCP family protein [Staphylospora marina]
MESRNHRVSKQKKKRKWLKILMTVLVLLVGAGGAYAWYVYDSVKQTANNMYSPIDREKSELREKGVDINQRQPFSVLLMGVDKREGDRGRSDSLMVMSVNPAKGSILMFSIPRDTRTEIVGRGTQDKINHAYAFGGVEMSIRTVEKFLNAPIDYYVQVDMEGFMKMVDAVGGVTVDSPFAFTYEGVSFPKGPVHLDGYRALKYTRMRYDDPRGDFGRQERQRQVLREVMKKAASPAIVTNMGDILASLQGSIRTNMTFDEMTAVATDYRGAAGNMETVSIKGKGTKIGGVYYYIVDQQERDRISSLLKQHLQLGENSS